MSPTIIASIIGASGTIGGVLMGWFLNKYLVLKENDYRKRRELVLYSLQLLIPEGFQLQNSYSDLLQHNFSKIAKELEDLHKQKRWADVIDLKVKIREFFEYSGQYSNGVSFGKIYDEALEDINKQKQSENTGWRKEYFWNRIKNIGYMQILDECYEEGRNTINSVMSDISIDSVLGELEKHELMFYCNRYMGISYMRDLRLRDYTQAKDFFKKAEANCSAFKSHNETKYQELRARILANFGNLYIEEGDPQAALIKYKESLGEFITLKKDIEHIGIAKLQIAQALINLNGEDIKTAKSFVDESSIAFFQIGWVEGQGRVEELNARIELTLASSTSDSNDKTEHLIKAKAFLQKARNIYAQLRLKNALARVDGMVNSITV